MDPIRLSRAALALLLAAILVGGVLLGSTIAALGDRSPSPSPSATPAATATASLPPADVAGEELARLPRYPGSLRSSHEIEIDDRFRLEAAEYLADADIDAVRAFYQRVIVEQGWTRADIGFDGAEWTYVLVDGRTEALVEIEESRGLVEIDLQISEPVDEPTPQPTSQPTPVPATPAPPPGDDDDDDDDDDESDDDDDGGASDG